MLQKPAVLAALSCIFAAYAGAQGLNTNASKDDWEEINFEFNTAALSDGFPSLLRLADLLGKHSGYRVKLEGNTDNIGSAKANERLGLARANTVRDFLVKYGARADQISTATRGKGNPETQGYKNRYSKTDVARWMNRRVVVTVTDEQGRTVSAGGIGDAIASIPPQAPAAASPCCDDILKRLDKLDDIARMLKDLSDQNAGLRKELDTLKSQQATLENEVKGLPKPLSEQQTSEVVDTRLEKFRDPRFALLGLNVGADDRRDLTFTGKARYFAPFKDHFAVQAQGEYLYFKRQQEGQFDLGLVDRIGRFQGSLFGSFKHVNLKDFGGGGNLGQAAVTFDYLFGRGRIGVFGTKAFLNNAVLGRSNLRLQSGVHFDDNLAFSVAPNIFVENFLRVVDQAGASTSVALFGPVYMEANIGYLRSFGGADRPGGTVRFVYPVSDRFAFTVEGGVNETLLGRNNAGRAVIGFEWGNFLRPKEFLESKYPVPVDVPRVRYEVLSRRVRNGVSQPIADAGPDQIGVAAGTITLNGSNSRDPNGEQLTYQWVQEAGPAVALSGANAAFATFPAVAGQAYSFRLTVTNTDGQSASARTRVTTRAAARVQILFFNADPRSIPAGQASTLSWRVLNATSVAITPGIGAVNPANGSVSVSPTETTTYKLTAKNAISEENATVTVTVQRPEPRVLTCTATPMNIRQGETATILYATENADTVSITGLGNVPGSGSVTVTPASTTTYTITAANRFASATCNVTVQVTPGTAPRIIRFTAAPMSIQSGAASTLVWQVENAKTVTITPNVGTVDLVGTRDVNPTQTTSYTLTATNDFGQATAAVTITVTPPPPPPPVNPAITSFTANPPVSPNAGAPVVLTCLASNANSVAISGVGPVNASGQVTVNPQTTTTYVCVATGANGAQASANLTVTVNTATGGGMPPVVVVVGGSGANCSGGGTVIGTSVPGTVFCQTVVRQVTLDLSGSSSPAGNTPLRYNVTSRNTAAAVLNPNSPFPIVQLSELFGDYLFDVTVTDSKGNTAMITIDVQFVKTRIN